MSNMVEGAHAGEVSSNFPKKKDPGGNDDGVDGINSIVTLIWMDSIFSIMSFCRTSTKRYITKSDIYSVRP